MIDKTTPPIIAGLHTVNKNREKDYPERLPCIVCLQSTYLSGYGMQKDLKVTKVPGEKRAIALECLAAMLMIYGDILLQSEQLVNYMKKNNKDIIDKIIKKDEKSTS